MLVKGIEPWSPYFHINVLAIKPLHHFVITMGYQMDLTYIFELS
jgi:hypothetical protein